MKKLNLEYVPCNLCGGNQSEPFFFENGFNIVKCMHCGLVFVNPRLSDFSKHLENEIVPEYMEYINSYSDRRKIYTLRFKRILKEIEAVIKGKGHILEIGCAAGFFLKEAEESGWIAQGVEPVRACARYATEQLQLDVINDSIEKVNFEGKKFDVIVSFNVLSHLENPTEFFFEIKRLLKRDGIFVFETGNKGGLKAQKHGEIWGESWLTPEHLYHFSEKTLDFLIEKTGFRTLKYTKRHVVDHVFSIENLNIKRDSKIKWLVKKILIRHNFLRAIISSFLKFYFITFRHADVCSLMYFVRHA